MDTIIRLDTNTKGPIRRFLELTGRVLLEPSRFYREELRRLTTSEAIAFGIANAWIAWTLAFFWSTLNSFFLVELFEIWVQRLLASDEAFSFLSMSGESFLWTAGSLVVAPFLLLARVFFSSFVLFLFSRFLIADSENRGEAVSFDACLRIRGSALTGQWFSIVPFFGSLLAFVATLVLSITGVRERFGTSTRRAAAVVLAPYAILLVLLAFLALFSLLALTQLPFEELLDFELQV